MKVCESVYLVGSGELSHSMDCMVYALDLGELVLVDCGAGPGWRMIRENIRDDGLDPDAVHTLVLTHAHVDHIGAVSQVVEETGCRVVAHELDAPAIESGDPGYTASTWYGLDLPRVRVDRRMGGEEEWLSFSGGELGLLRCPGHTPGSIVAFLDTPEGLVLFGQDVHGPFSDDFDSDIDQWRRSMAMLLELGADILCEGHYGIYRGKGAVRDFIEGQLHAHRWEGR